jgi:hypothetical protein
MDKTDIGENFNIYRSGVSVLNDVLRKRDKQTHTLWLRFNRRSDTKAPGKGTSNNTQHLNRCK